MKKKTGELVLCVTISIIIGHLGIVANPEKTKPQRLLRLNVQCSAAQEENQKL